VTVDAPPVVYQPTGEQQAVIDAQEGTTLVLAAVGSGKTSTLCRRVARTIAEGISPDRVLALTFTNRAARHLHDGLQRMMPAADASRVLASTFHGLCHQILREESEEVGLSSEFAILDEEECIAILDELQVPDAKSEIYVMAGEAADVPSREATVDGWMSGSFSKRPWARAYLRALGDREAVDFSGLVLLTRALLTREEARKRWAGRFDAVLVDEVQDTHMSEYEVIRSLASEAKSLCLVGDLDQTIYGWRGSRPDQLLTALDRDFAPVQRLHLTANFRSTRRIIELANRLAQRMPERTTVVAPHPSLPEGEAVQTRCYAEASDEAHNIARCCAEAIAEGTPAEEVAILVRGKKEIRAISAALSAHEVPHITTDQLRFYRHAEVADCLAVATLVHDRSDEARMRRVARGMVQGIDSLRARQLATAGRTLGLQLCDLIRSEKLRGTDPLGALDTDRVVVLDTETTGVNPMRDEIIEIAALRVINGQPSERPEDRMSVLLKASRTVGSSEAVHGISDADLAEKGVPPRAALSALSAFVGEDPIAGHNVAFDQRMLESHAARVGLRMDLSIAYDTLHMSRRLIECTRHDLGSLVHELKIPFEPTHRALDDVRATAALAQLLRERASTGRDERLAWLETHQAPFERLAQALDTWAAEDLRPGDLIRRLKDALMKHKVPDPKTALPRLEELALRIDAMDDPALTPSQSLRRALATAALVREGDGVDSLEGVRVLSMHQSKGLEFTRVFLPQLVQNVLPSYHTVLSRDPTKLAEERRLLYVAMTRAKRRLYLSWHSRNARGYPADPSTFLGELLSD
jgi:DNA helicase-2/ATP-dependent DNA helicase PcrA